MKYYTVMKEVLLASTKKFDLSLEISLGLLGIFRKCNKIKILKALYFNNRIKKLHSQFNFLLLIHDRLKTCNSVWVEWRKNMGEEKMSCGKRYQICIRFGFYCCFYVNFTNLIGLNPVTKIDLIPVFIFKCWLIIQQII